MILRNYQQTLYDGIHEAWAIGLQNVLAVSVTGSGKSVIISEVIKNHTGTCAVMAHTSELIYQLSMLLAHRGIYHDIIAPQHVINDICKMHVTEYQTCFYRDRCNTYVISAPTMVRRLDHDYSQVSLWICDEAQHLLKAPGLWGKCVEAFGAGAKGLGVTATPTRADGKGLGRHASGYFDVLIEGPTVGELIGQGYLSDYQMFAPDGINTEGVQVTSGGEFNQKQLTNAAEKSTITGDVVAEYQRLAVGRQGITFCVNVQIAEETTDAYNAAGIPACLITSKTPAAERFNIMRDFRAGKYLQAVNVQTLTEGVDLPQIGVISLARPTMSLALFRQMVGRVLRVAKGDNRPAVIIDHGGNLLRHGAPDTVTTWTLDRRDRKSAEPDPDLIPLRICTGCAGTYEIQGNGRICPYCGHEIIPVQGAGPIHVSGDLTLLTAEKLAELRGEPSPSPDDVYQDMRSLGMSELVCRSNRKRQEELLTAREALVDAIRAWGGACRAAGMDDSVAYVKFYRCYGIDVLTAQTLKRRETIELTEKINCG